MEAIINAYTSRELVCKPELLPLRNDSPLLASSILNSLSALNLEQVFQDQFEVEIAAENLIPAHFETVEAIRANLHNQHPVQGVQV